MTDTGRILTDGPDSKLILSSVKQALWRVTLSLPHFSGLAHLIKITTDDRVPSIGICATGRMLVNKNWFYSLDSRSATFVVAHELMHLALKTHDRSSKHDIRLFNIAHDYIINDMLVESLGGPVPADGLEWPGAREMSAEKIVALLKEEKGPKQKDQKYKLSEMEEALNEALDIETNPTTGKTEDDGWQDVISRNLEKEWFPDESQKQHTELIKIIDRSVAKATSLGVLKENIEKAIGTQPMYGRGNSPGGCSVMTKALKSLYRPSWEMALQHWMESVMMGSRSFARPSRRQGSRSDVVLPGRKREGFTLHIVLDTSGSMNQSFSRILGIISSFCESANVDIIHILQCDTGVTVDEWIDPAQLEEYAISGLGGSDMSPAMLELAKDPRVESAIVITDGHICYPEQPMPYKVLWVLTEEDDWFSPDYGKIIPLPQVEYD